MLPYDKEFDPPAPTIYVEIKHPSKNVSVKNVKMLLDSGADLTCVPKNVLEQIPFLGVGIVNVQSYDTQAIKIEKTWYISLHIAEYEFDHIEVLGIEENCGLLGRDIINELNTILNGPRLEWNLKEQI